jgi:hypothetical protein
MALSLPLLAQNEDPTMKIVIGLAFAAFWIVAQILAALGKNKEKANRRTNEPLAEAPSPSPPPLRVPRQTNVPRPQQSQRRSPVEAPPARQRPPKVKRRPPAMPPPLRAPAVMRSATVAVPAPVEEFDPHATVVAKPKAADRVRAALQPASLREHFILVEVLGKPVALRDSNDTPGG